MDSTHDSNRQIAAQLVQAAATLTAARAASELSLSRAPNSSNASSDEIFMVCFRANVALILHEHLRVTKLLDQNATSNPKTSKAPRLDYDVDYAASLLTVSGFKWPCLDDDVDLADL